MENRNRQEDTFSILIASDCHLGYKERDPIRGHDSLVTFEEIFELAKEKEVDFVLLGGDLFHDNKPSRTTLHGCMEILRKYCLGDRPCQVEFLSDQSVNFWSSSFPVVNYEDPNYNISIPVFTIHGNHDDPSGPKSLSAIDLLSSSGLVNYFGKTNSVDEITISPILLQKGKTKMALYGLGSIRDERLHRLFASERISMLQPKKDTDKWFNIMVLHQNRIKHGEKNYIPEEFLNDFLDLVIWGHEHECLISPEWNPKTNFFVCQPGSSIATALTESEAKKKHVAILKVIGKTFKIEEIPLKTVRPFSITDIALKDTDISSDARHEDQIVAYVKEKIESMISKTAGEHSGNARQPSEPLIRLKVEHSGGYTPFNTLRFGQQFVGRVANPKDVLQFYKKRAKREITEEEEREDEENPFENDKQALSGANEPTVTIEDIITDLFSSEASYQMRFLSEKAISEAIRVFVDKEENDVIEQLVEHSLKKMQGLLKKNQSSTNLDLDQQVAACREAVFEREEVEKAIESARNARRRRESDENPREQSSDMDEDVDRPSQGRQTNVSQNSRNRGRSRGIGLSSSSREQATSSRGQGTGRGLVSDRVTASRGRASSKSSTDEDDASESDDLFRISTQKRLRRS